jgi:predicted transcriptional regulator
MTEEEFEKIRDKDHIVLKHIEEGREDVQKITAETTLENHHVSYCFEKLEELGLITVEKPDRMVERVVDGQKRVFQHPKMGELTEKGREYLEESERENSHKHENLTQGELSERIHNLENQVSELEKAFEVFKSQVSQKLE